MKKILHYFPFRRTSCTIVYHCIRFRVFFLTRYRNLCCVICRINIAHHRSSACFITINIVKLNYLPGGHGLNSLESILYQYTCKVGAMQNMYLKKKYIQIFSLHIPMFIELNLTQRALFFNNINLAISIMRFCFLDLNLL